MTNIFRKAYDSIKNTGKNIAKVAGMAGLGLMLSGKPALAEEYPMLEQRTQEYSQDLQSQSRTAYEQFKQIKNYIATDEEGNYSATPGEMNAFVDSLSAFTDNLGKTRLNDKVEGYKDGVDDTTVDYELKMNAEEKKKQTELYDARQNGRLEGRLEEQEESKPFHEAEKKLAVEKALQDKAREEAKFRVNLYGARRHMVDSANGVEPVDGMGLAVSRGDNVFRLEFHGRKGYESADYGYLNTDSASLALSLGRILGRKDFGDLETSAQLGMVVYNENTRLQGQVGQTSVDESTSFTGPAIEGTVNFDLGNIHVDLGRRQYLNVTNMDHTGENIVRIGINNKKNKSGN